MTPVDGGAPAATPPRARRCPICGRPEAPDLTPFCSRRCADVDLHRWLGEGYRVPAELDQDTGDIPDAG